MTQLDEFTRRLLGNGELLAIHQDGLGAPAGLVRAEEETGIEVWSREVADGGVAVAVANMGEEAREVRVTWEELGRNGAGAARDLWRWDEVATDSGGVTLSVRRHSAEAIRVEGRRS